MSTSIPKLPVLPTVCGHCSAELPKPLRCAGCGCRSYCGRECQKSDWAIHRLHCVNPESQSDVWKTVRAYDRKFGNDMLTLGLELFKFPQYFARLEGADRDNWLDHSLEQCVFVDLTRVVNPAPGRWNRLSFQHADLVDIDDLPGDHHNAIRQRLSDRFPAICIAYAVNDPAGGPSRVITTTHPFSWPAFKPIPIGIDGLTRFILLREWVLNTIALEAEEARLKKKFMRDGLGDLPKRVYRSKL